MDKFSRDKDYKMSILVYLPNIEQEKHKTFKSTDPNSNIRSQESSPSPLSLLSFIMP